METPNVPEALGCAIRRAHIGPIDPAEVSYYLGREAVIPTGKPSGTAKSSGMARWREALFALMTRNAERSGARVPCRQVVEIGIEIAI